MKNRGSKLLGWSRSRFLCRFEGNCDSRFLTSISGYAVFDDVEFEITLWIFWRRFPAFAVYEIDLAMAIRGFWRRFRGFAVFDDDLEIVIWGFWHRFRDFAVFDGVLEIVIWGFWSRFRGFAVFDDDFEIAILDFCHRFQGFAVLTAILAFWFRVLPFSLPICCFLAWIFTI